MLVNEIHSGQKSIVTVHILIFGSYVLHILEGGVGISWFEYNFSSNWQGRIKGGADWAAARGPQIS